ncbi:hypothetical protein Tsubulata_043346, partial [Turnera subulata]
MADTAALTSSLSLPLNLSRFPNNRSRSTKPLSYSPQNHPRRSTTTFPHFYYRAKFPTMFSKESPLLLSPNNKLVFNVDYSAGEEAQSLTPDASNQETFSWPSVILPFLFPALGGLLFGYDIGATSGATISLQVSGSLYGALLGSILVYPIADFLGRRRELIAAAVFYVFGGLITASAPGLGAMHGAPLYIAETCPSQIRGTLISLKELFIVLGILLGYFVGSIQIDAVAGWRYMFGLSAPIALLMGLGMWSLPPSPRWLLLRAVQGKASFADYKEKAILALGKLRGRPSGDKVSERQVEETLVSLKSAYEGEESEGNLLEVFQGPSLKAFVIGGGLVLFQQITGQPSVLYYAGPILQISFGPISWLMVSEIFPLRTRGKGISLAVLTNFGSNAIVTFAFSPLKELLGAENLFLLFGAIALLSLLFAVAVVPETKVCAVVDYSGGERTASLTPPDPSIHDDTFSWRSVILPFLYPALGGLLFGYDIGATSGATLSLQWFALWSSSRFHPCLSDHRFFGSFVRLRWPGYGPGSKHRCSPCREAPLRAWHWAMHGAPLYIAETCPSKIRGTLISLKELFLGYFVGSIKINSVAGWRSMFGLSASIALVMGIGMWSLPPSPCWLLLRAIQGKASFEDYKEKSILALGKLRGRPPHGKVFERQIEETLISLKSAYGGEGSEVKFLEVFQGRSLKAFIIGGGLVLFQQISFGPISWLMVSEIFPLRTRGKGISLAVLTNFGFNAIVTFAFPPLKELLGADTLFFLFGVIALLSLLFTVVFVPETKELLRIQEPW